MGEEVYRKIENIETTVNKIATDLAVICQKHRDDQEAALKTFELISKKFLNVEHMLKGNGTIGLIREQDELRRNVESLQRAEKRKNWYVRAVVLAVITDVVVRLSHIGIEHLAGG